MYSELSASKSNELIVSILQLEALFYTYYKYYTLTTINSTWNETEPSLLGSESSIMDCWLLCVLLMEVAMVNVCILPVVNYSHYSTLAFTVYSFHGD